MFCTHQRARSRKRRSSALRGSAINSPQSLRFQLLSLRWMRWLSISRNSMIAATMLPPLEIEAKLKKPQKRLLIQIPVSLEHINFSKASSRDRTAAQFSYMVMHSPACHTSQAAGKWVFLRAHVRHLKAATSFWHQTNQLSVWGIFTCCRIKPQCGTNLADIYMWKAGIGFENAMIFTQKVTKANLEPKQWHTSKKGRVATFSNRARRILVASDLAEILPKRRY